jgi:hypothetical protein
MTATTSKNIDEYHKIIFNIVQKLETQAFITHDAIFVRLKSEKFQHSKKSVK